MRIILFFLMFFISGCTGPLAVVGQVYGGADTITSMTTGKSATDTIISTGTNKDCRIHRLFKEEPVCKEKKNNKVEVKKEKSILKNITNFFKFK